MEKLMDLSGMENYYEQIVQKKLTMQAFILLVLGFIFCTVGIIVGAILSFTFGIFIPITIGLVILAGWMIWHIMKNTRLEYEYTFVSGEMRIERIKNKLRRRKVTAFDVKSIDDIGPLLDPETNELAVDEKKYELVLRAAGTAPEDIPYYVVIHDKVRHKPALLIFTPNEITLKKIRPFLSVELKKKFMLREKKMAEAIKKSEAKKESAE